MLLAVTSAGGAGVLVAVAVVTVLEDSVGLGVFLPAESVIIAAGAASASGVVPLWAVVLVAWVGGVAGDTIGFLVGRRFGPRLVERYGAKLRLTPARLADAEAVVDRWGPLAVAGGRLIPALRVVVMPVAGAAGMPLVRFLAADVVGVGLWATFHVGIGYAVGRGLVSDHAAVITVAAIGLAAVAVGVVAALRHHHRRVAATSPAGAAPAGDGSP
jgi:membrane protein DedA with SNARE-associated domain